MSNGLDRTKLTVHQYKSLDEELSAIIAGVFRQGRDSHDWVIDWHDEAANNLVPNNVAAIKQAIEKWSKL